MKSKILEHNQAYINRWIVSYADFVTMLLALFMVLYALSQLDLNNLTEFSDSINKAFDKKPNSNMNINFNYKESRLAELFSTTKMTVYLDEENLPEADFASTELKNRIKAYEKTINTEAQNFENIRKKLEDEINSSKIEIIREPRGLLIRLNDTILFNRDSDIMKDKPSKILDKIADILKNEPNLLRIEAHTDNTPVDKENFSSSLDLSAARATNVTKYFVEEHKIRPERIFGIGYGDHIPVSDNKTKEGRSKNSRVDIIVLNELSKIFEPDITR